MRNMGDEKVEGRMQPRVNSFSRFSSTSIYMNHMAKLSVLSGVALELDDQTERGA